MAENITPIGGFSQAGAEKLHEMTENSTVFAEYLKFHGRMFKQSPSISLEFFVQRPEARFVAKQSQWEKAGNPVLPDNAGLRFRDSHGEIVELYDFTQCENQEHEPYQWRMTEAGEAAVRAELGLPADQNLLNGLVNRVVTPESVTAIMQRLNVPPQDVLNFQISFRSTVAAMIAGRMEVGGNSFTVQVDESAIKQMNDTQRLGFITMAAVSAKQVLNQVEQVMNDRRAAMRAERMVQNEVRGISGADSRGNAADSGQRAAGSTEGDAAQLPDQLEGDAERRRAGLGSGTADEQRQQDILSAAAEKQADRERDLLVSGESDNRDIRDADRTGRTIDGGRTNRELRHGVDALDGGQSSGEGRGNAVLSPVSDGGSVSGQESVGVPEQTGRTVHGNESPSARIREHSNVGASEDALHRQRGDAGRSIAAGNGSVTDKIAQAFAAPTEKPSTDQADGFVMQNQTSKPLTPAQEQKIQRNAAEDEAFRSKIDAYVHGETSTEEVFRVSTTPYSLRIAGASAIPVIMKQSVLKNSLASGKTSSSHTEGHELSAEIMKQLPAALRNPIFVCNGSKKGSMAVITDLVGRDGNHLLVSLKLNASGRRSEVNSITSVYGKKNIANYIQKEFTHGNVLAVNIEKAETLSADIGVQFPKWTDILCFDDSITYSDENVKRFSDISPQEISKNEPEKPITSERRAEILAEFSRKYGLDGLDVFVKKDKGYSGDGRAYDLLIKNGRQTEFQARVFTLAQGERFTEAVLQSGLADLEQTEQFQQFFSFRSGQHTLFEQIEAEKVATSSNFSDDAAKPELDAETIAIRQREIDKAISTMQRRLERTELTSEKRRELEYIIAFLQSDDAEHIEITQEAIDTFRAKREQERAARLEADVQREWEEAAEHDVAADLEAHDALDHHRDVYLEMPNDDNSGYPITDARRQQFYNYRLHFEADQGYLLMADSDTEDDLILRSFATADSSAVLRGVRDMGLTVTGVEPAFTYDIYQVKSGAEHHYHRFESLEVNRYAHLTHEDYDLVYSGNLRDIEGDTVDQKLGRLYEMFNINHPADFYGHSMSTSDVVVVTEGSGRTPYYVQPTGFEVMPDFFADKFDLIDIQFIGNPQGFNAIKVAARTDAFDDTGETNMLIADTPVFYARLSENADLADVQKVIQTAYENNCYLTADSVAYLTERFGEGFMPELPPVNTVFEIPESDQTVDLAAVESFTLTDSYSKYEGGMNSDGHERRDNYSGHSQTLTFTYRGNGIVESEMWSDQNDYPITDTYNLYSPAQRDRLFADMYRFVDRAEELTTHSEPKAEPAKPRYVLMLNVPDVQIGGIFDKLEDAQDAGNEAIWDGKAVGYAILNQHEHKVEVYDGDFPSSGVFSDEVYANSPFQTLSIHTDAPLPALHEDAPAQTDTAEPASTLQFGLLGNGITVYDTAREEPHSHDYLTVAHISEEGNVHYYAEITDSDRKRVEDEAARQLDKFTESWNAKSDTEKLLTLMRSATPSQVVTIAADKLPADQLVEKYEKSVIFRSEEFPAEKNVHLVITNAGFDGGIDDKKEYATLEGAITAGRAYLADDYLGFAVYNTETKQIEHIEGDFPLHQSFNPEILRLNGMNAEADEAEQNMKGDQTVALMSDAADVTEGAISWNIVHDADDDEGKPTTWSAQVDSDEYGKYIWIEKSDNGYDVVINNNHDDMVVFRSFDALDEAQNYVEEEMLTNAAIQHEQDSDTVGFQRANLARFFAVSTLSSDEWEDMAYPLYDKGYMDKHQPSENASFSRNMSETALFALARRFHAGEDIRRELALGLLEQRASDDIEFVIQDGIMSNRLFASADDLPHYMLHIETKADGIQCSFNGTERFVSYEEIGQAFLDRTREEFDDLAFWWIRDDMRAAIPDISDERIGVLISAFDGALTPNWENADYQPIKQALTDILGDGEQVDKAFAIIAREKYHVTVSENAHENISDISVNITPEPKPTDTKRRLLDIFEDYSNREFGEPADTSDYSHIPLAFTTNEDNELAIEVYADIETLRLVSEYNHTEVRVERYDSLDAMADALEGMSFDELTAFSDAEQELANRISSTKKHNKHLIDDLNVGDQIMLPTGKYTVRLIDDEDYLLDLSPVDGKSISLTLAGDWREMLFDEAGNEPISVIKRVDISVNSKPKAAGQSEPAEKEKKRGRLTRPEELYKLLSEMYPQIISGERTHEHYEADADSGYEPLSVEMIGDDLYSFMTYYIQNGDLMRDPDITFMLDHEEKTAHVFSFQQDGVPPHGTYYVEVADENGRVDTKLQASLEQTFLQNLKNAQAADRTLTRYHDRLGEEVVLVPDIDDAPETEEPTEPIKADANAHLREVLNAFSEEYGLGELNLQFTDAHHVGIFETYADGSDQMLGVQGFWSDNEQISPEECKEILTGFAADEKRRGRRVEDAMSRKYTVAARGKSELPPVPDDLPEIIYAKAPLQKVRDNIEAIRELHRLARCEQAGRTLYDKRRNQWNCKENSDERLRKYSGWGGLQQVFDAKSGRYAQLREELQKLLTPEEYASAKASATDAHYTPQIVIDAMYQAIQNMEIPRDSRVLEPACGTGNFITRMPHSIGNAGVVGVELDDITAQIAARLNADNPNVTIMHSAFEQSGQTDNSFDLVIGNVPFGDYKMNDPDYTQDWLIHDAFFRKALDKVAAGGVVAFVTSTGTLDKKNPKVREYLATQADLIGAIRLPNTAFSDAGTGVPTDIIFLQKRAEPLSPDAPKPDWCYVAPISETDRDMRINSYFVQNPQMMLDTMRKTSFQDRLTCDPIAGADLKKQLENAVKQLNAKIIVTKREKAAQERRGYIQPWGKQFTYQEKDGKYYFNEGKTIREITGTAKEMDRLKRLIELRTLTRQLIDKQKTMVGDHELVSMRLYLNQQYDDFVAKYGQLNSDVVKKAFGADADFSLLQSLEEYDSDSKTYYKAEIFNKRTVNPIMEITAVETLEEAYQVSLDRRGKPNIPYMATLLQAQYPDTPFTELTQQVQRDLLNQGMIYIDPEKEIAGEEFSGIVERAEYLSGNVRRKLAYAMDRAAENPDFQRNVEALREVIPEDIHAEEIAVRMGAAWIDPEDYTKFLQELSGRRSWDTRCDVKYSPVSGEFDILQAGSRKDINVNEGTTYGTDKLTMYEIAQKLLNQRRIAVMMTVPSPKDASKTVSRTDPVETKKAMEKAKLIEAKFAEWIFADPQRKAKYERRYNDLFNSLVGRKYDGSHLTFEGQSALFTLRPHQRDCVARAVYGGNTLAAHVVGAGKSAVFQTAVMKKKQLGLINKACVVVPKPLVEQTAREWRKLYPDARLLTMSAADLSSEAKRDLFAARIATGDYDAVIVSMEQFEKMPMSQEFQRNYLQRQLDALEDMLREAKLANGNRKDATTKQIEVDKKKLKHRLENIMNPKSKQKGKDILLDFEQLGFDYLVVDEAHNYKNGFVTTKMGNVSGVTTTASGRAQDMQMKCDYLNEQLGQGHLLFCTGTPIAAPYQH